MRKLRRRGSSSESVRIKKNFPKVLLISVPGMQIFNRAPFSNSPNMYRPEKKSLIILLSSTQEGPGRKVKQEQEEISRNHVQRLFLGSVFKSIVQRCRMYDQQLVIALSYK